MSSPFTEAGTYYRTSIPVSFYPLYGRGGWAKAYDDGDQRLERTMYQLPGSSTRDLSQLTFMINSGLRIVSSHHLLY